jgi:hypothetical protein
MTPPTLPFNVPPLAQTIFRVVVSSALFLTVECILDCSGLDQLADYYEFLDQQQETLIENNTEKQVSKAIGKLFINPQNLQVQLG